MKWHSANKARKALQTIKDLGIDPGHGYKIEVVRDNDVDPPSMPATPKKLSPLKDLNSILMKGAHYQAKKRKEEKEKEIESSKGRKKEAASVRFMVTEKIMKNENLKFDSDD